MKMFFFFFENDIVSVRISTGGKKDEKSCKKCHVYNNNKEIRRQKMMIMTRRLKTKPQKIKTKQIYVQENKKNER